MSPPLAPRRVWGAPIAVAVVTAIGLVAALLGDGLADVASWLALAVPIAVTLWCVARSR